MVKDKLTKKRSAKSRAEETRLRWPSRGLRTASGSKLSPSKLTQNETKKKIREKTN